MAISKRIAYLADYLEEADLLRATYGLTERHPTGIKELDAYLGGGVGRPNGYEIVLLYGPTKIGKSTIALNILKKCFEDNTKVGLLILEDDMADVLNRIRFILDPFSFEPITSADNPAHVSVVCLPKGAMDKGYTLDELLEYIREWFVSLDYDIVLLDHLQFAFDSADSIRGENEFTAQRVFMRNLNTLMKEVKKTIILVSHTNAQGNIYGSSALRQVATKILRLEESERPGVVNLWMKESRFTNIQHQPLELVIVGGKIKVIGGDSK